MLADALCGVAAMPPRRSTDVREAVRGIREKARVRIPTATSEMWVSGLGRLCPRAYGLAAAHKRTLDADQDAGTIWTFAVGEAIHRAMQRRILVQAGILQGWWERWRMVQVDGEGAWRQQVDQQRGPAWAGGALSHGWMPCPGPDWHYVEMVLRDEARNVAGRPDGVLVWPDGTVEVVEIKTASARGFSRLDPWVGGLPLPEHVVQLQVYMDLLGLLRGRLIYLNKGTLDHGADSAMVEWVVERDEALLVEVWAAMARARATVAGVEAILAGGGAARTAAAWVRQTEERGAACARSGLVRARRCPVRALCFPRCKQLEGA